LSIQIEFLENLPSLKRLKLPTRYYHFNDGENYIKLLSVGEGIFPKDRIQTSIKLENSSCVITTESATKVYPSTHTFGINRLNFTLKQKANLEYINDELILYSKAKFIQLVNFKVDSNATFFYVDVMSSGRSFEYFDFTQLKMRNRFVIDDELEYFENFSVNGSELKSYFERHGSDEYYFAKIYIKSPDNEFLKEYLRKLGFAAFGQTRNKQILLSVLSNHKISDLKESILTVWNAYRQQLNKSPFDLGKA